MPLDTAPPTKTFRWEDPLDLSGRLTEEERTCGVCVIDLRSGQAVALLRFESAVQEVFAVTVLPGIVHPDLINESGETLDSSFVLPDDALRDVPGELRTNSDQH